MADKALAKKFKLKKIGKPNRTSKRTIEQVRSLVRRNTIINESGKNSCDSDNRLYGK